MLLSLRINTLGSFIKFSHSVFALPFALSIFIILNESQKQTLLSMLWIIVAVVGARTAAMAFNRIADADIDAKNPRTSARELPSGAMSKSQANLVLLLGIAAFFLASFALGIHCLVLAPFVMLLLLGYSLVKRISNLSHFVLGLALACAPGGVWYALTAQFSWIPVPLMSAVLFWVAGFDIIYSCQDVAFDTAQGLHSIPERIGVGRALLLARFLHVVTVLLLVLFGVVADRQTLYFVGVGVFAIVIASQHALINAEDFSRVDQAFFVRNGVGSFVFFFGVLLDSLLRNAI